MKAPTSKYDNFDTTLDNVKSLGFEIIKTSYGKTVLSRDFNGTPVYIVIWDETQCWDGYDTLHVHLCFAIPKGEPRSNAYSIDGGYLGGTKIPSRETLRDEITGVFSDLKTGREHDLRQAYKAYQAVAGLTWPDE